jgi:FemAB-related protein (PEP-CTERM system-associated)
MRPAADVGPVNGAQAVDPAAWDRFVGSSPGAPSYARRGWLDLLADSFSLAPIALAASRGGELRGVLPMIAQSNPVHGVRLTSLPFVNYGGIVATDDQARSELIAACAEEVRRRGAAHAELRHLPGGAVELPASTHKVRPVLDLPADAASLWDGFGAKLRSQVRRPTKEGIEAEVGGAERLDDFYRVLAVRWRQLGSPVYRRSFFARILAEFPGEHAIVTVRAGDTIVGAGWLHLYGGSCEIPWAATLVEWNRSSPNMLLYWRAIETAIERGCSQFDFGRSTEGAPTHAFKMQWGPRCEPLPWHYVLGKARAVPGPTGEGSAAEAFRRAWSRLPLSWTIRLGHAFARRLPF